MSSDIGQVSDFNITGRAKMRNRVVDIVVMKITLYDINDNCITQNFFWNPEQVGCNHDQY